ncbi:MAG: BCAM0308 family protein [Methylococcaceae bacterium]
MHQENLSSHTLTRDTHRVEEWRHDPYLSRKKWPEPCYCPDCGVVYRHGNWQWADIPEHGTAIHCPACLRIRDKCPAAFLVLAGDFFTQHKEEIIRRVRTVEDEHRGQHPLMRIMAEQDSGTEYHILYTDPHLARATGQAIHSAFRGQLHITYQKNEYLLRVSWVR